VLVPGFLFVIATVHACQGDSCAYLDYGFGSFRAPGGWMERVLEGLGTAGD
jgi:hypothetical protein